jgi:hypothetical protein
MAPWCDLVAAVAPGISLLLVLLLLLLLLIIEVPRQLEGGILAGVYRGEN